MIRNDPAVRPHQNRLVRGILIVVGTILVGIGILGMFLPLLPTTIFLLGAAACYARASERFYERLLANRMCGPFIREWREHRTVPRRARRTALLLIVASFSTSITFFVPGILWRVIVGLVGVGVFTIVWRLPVREPAGADTAAAPLPATRTR